MITDINQLSDLAWSYRAARTLQVANQLDIFTLLSAEPLTSDQIAQKCNSNPDITNKILIACVAMGLLKKTHDKYQNSKLSAQYLVKDKPLYQGNMIAHSAAVWDFWTSLPDMITTPGIQQTRPPFNHTDFILGMLNITAAGRGQLFIDNIDLTGRKKLFDVGGGPGTYSILACRHYPHLKAVLFDLPETLEIAKDLIAKENLSGRITLQPGNWDTDPFGTDNDVVLFSNVLHGSPSQAEIKLKKAHDSMTKGSLLVIQDFLMNDKKTGPLIPALFNIMVGAYSRPELIKIIEDTGFKNINIPAQSEKLACTWITAEKP